MSTWIYRIALNVCLSAKRRSEKNIYNTVRLDSIEFSAADQSHQDDEEKYKALKECISLLNERDQAIVILLLEDLPYKDIALISGLTENHVAVRMKRIRTTLLKCITTKIKI